MRRYERPAVAHGFALVELLVVLVILSVLITVAAVSYRGFIKKAQAVEGEVLVHELERLQYLYHAAHHTYSDSLSELGLTVSGEQYIPQLRKGSESTGVNFQVRALPLSPDRGYAWLLTRFQDGKVQIDHASAEEITSYATVRLSGNSAPMSSREVGTAYLTGHFSGAEPEWSGSGSTSRCQECGRVVIHRKK